MNEYVLRGQFASHLVLGEEKWIITVVRLDKPDLWYQVEATNPEGNITRFEMTRTPVGKWISHAQETLPSIISDHLDDVGKIISNGSRDLS